MSKKAKNSAIATPEQSWVLGDENALMVSRVEVERNNSVRLHPNSWAAFAVLADQAAKAGFELRIASGYRSFERQLAIWNGKLDGTRLLLDEHNKPLLLSDMSPEEQVGAVLRFSALPGASRHHWGSDADVYDGPAISEGDRLSLTPQEYSAEGVQGRFAYWLNEQLQPGQAMAKLFSRPYGQDCGGVAVEPWHLSHRAVSAKAEQLLTMNLVQRRLSECDMIHRDYVLAHLPEIWQRFVEPAGQR